MLATLQDVTDKLVAEYQPERIILFGSRAVGNARVDSDFDILVVKETEASRRDRCAQVETMLADRGIALDLDVLTPAEMLLLYRKGSPFVTTIVETGKVLYVRDVTNEWLRDAEQELEVAEVLVAAKKTKAACLHAQRAAEKALKAMVLERGGTLQRSHDLVLLRRQVRSSVVTRSFPSTMRFF